MGYSVIFKNHDNEIPIKIALSNDTKDVTSVDDMIKVMPRPSIDIIFNYNEIDYQEILGIYLDDNKLSEISIYYADESGKNEIFVHFDYVIRISLTTKQDPDNNDNIIVIMSLAQLTEVDRSLRKMSSIIAKDHNYLTLEEYKDAKIEESKILLEKFLIENPMMSDCHGGEIKAYNATKDKRDLFVSAMFTYQMKKQAGLPAILKWNATGEECTEWTEEEGIQFAIDMETYITPLVAAQQAFEIQIKNAQTKQELDKLNINYSEIF